MRALTSLKELHYLSAGCSSAGAKSGSRRPDPGRRRRALHRRDVVAESSLPRLQGRLCRNRPRALQLASSFRPDLVILDVMLPDTDGFALLHGLRTDRPMPVLFLTARDVMEDKLRGLTLGADDYVTKPFSLEEVVARVGVILRRSRQVAGDSSAGRLAYADLILDEEAHEVWRGDTLIQLSRTEFALLRFLLRNQGRAMSRAQILEHVWHYDFNGDPSVVDSYIRYLRRKIDIVDPPLVQTVRGIGYTLRVPHNGR